MGFYGQFGKRTLDLLLCLLGSTLLLPLLLVVSLFVRLTLGSPIIFRQQRAGKDGRPFFLYKFRTMNDQRDTEGNLLPDEERLTRAGKFLRRTSLDELPALYNVLIGEMSLVGPRPLLIQYLALYSAEQLRRHDVLPGVTGWAQINGRNAISWEDRFVKDIWYIDHLSLTLDVKILWMTVSKVFLQDGISQASHATMPEFRGTQGINSDVDGSISVS